MFRYPLQTSDNAPAVILDAHGVPVMSTCDAERARFVVDALNDPAGHFLDHCIKQRALAFVCGDDKAREFWQRLEGSVRKAQAMR